MVKLALATLRARPLSTERSREESRMLFPKWEGGNDKLSKWPIVIAVVITLAVIAFCCYDMPTR